MNTSPTFFNADVAANHGYRYTTRAPLSSQLANRHLTQATLALLPRLSGRKPLVIDVGCGDGAYTVELAQARPSWHYIGFDLAEQAIKVATKNYPSRKYRNVHFQVGDVLQKKTLPTQKAELAIIRGVFHHLPRPAVGVKNAVALAGTSIIIEPNGNNPILKIIEKVSPYHRAHQEQSFSTQQLTNWVQQAGATIESVSYVGLVPFFCPNWMASALKYLEPWVEVSWFARWWCAQQILVVTKTKK